MKRVQVSPGKFVTISTAIQTKAAKVFASGFFTPAQVREMAKAEPSGSVLLGKVKPAGGHAKTPMRKPRVTSN